MSDRETLPRDTPTSPDGAPSKTEGDAFLDQSGSRHGQPPTPDPEDVLDDPIEDPAAEPPGA